MARCARVHGARRARVSVPTAAASAPQRAALAGAGRRRRPLLARGEGQQPCVEVALP